MWDLQVRVTSSPYLHPSSLVPAFAFFPSLRARKVVSSPRFADRRDLADLLNPLDVQKCDSVVPRCGRCVRNGVPECTYDQTRKKRPGNALAMGEACLPCRLVVFPSGSWQFGNELSNADAIFSSLFFYSAKKKVRPSSSSALRNGTEL